MKTMNVIATLSASVLVSAAAAQPCLPSTIPAAPVNVVAHDGESCLHTLVEWTPVSGATLTSFRVWRAWMGDLDGTEMVADGLEQPFYFDSDAAAGDSYTYWVQAVSVVGCASETSASDAGFRRPEVPGLGKQPGDVQADPGETASFDVIAFDATGIRWRKDGIELVDGDGVLGAHTNQLTIPAVATEDVGYYDAVLFNECGQLLSDPAVLRVGSAAPCQLCPVDYDADGGVDHRDLEFFFTDWEQGAPCADVSRDGGVDFGDIEVFVELWTAGNC
jgi:hypothetical protein